MELTRLQKRQLKTLEDTIDFYGKDTSRRGVSDRGKFSECLYFDKITGNRCAISRLCTLKICKILPKGVVTERKVWNKLPFRVKSLTQKFLWKLQNFHDSPWNWGETKGLTNSGRSVAKEIKTNILNNEFPQ